MDRAAEDLGPEADGPVGVPGLRIDADETGDSGNQKKPKNRGLWILVPFEYLHRTIKYIALQMNSCPLKCDISVKNYEF